MLRNAFRCSWAGRRPSLALLLVLALATTLLLPPLATVAQEGEQDKQIHVVVPGETLYGIAARYGVTVQSIAQANDLSNPNFLRSGTRLAIPAPEGQTGVVHIVRRGENLTQVAAQYGVAIRDILLANNLANPNFVFAGQRLLIPVVEEAGETPVPPAEQEAPETTATEAPAGQEPSAPEATGTPEPVVAEMITATVSSEGPAVAITPTVQVEGPAPACPTGCEEITIISPTVGMTVTSPLEVTGFGSGFEQTLAIRVLDASGTEIGMGTATVNAEPGVTGRYTGTVTYTVPANTQPGRIQVYRTSPRDGAIEHLTSTMVTLLAPSAGEQGVVDQLAAALAGKDYAALQDLMSESWVLGFYMSEALVLTPAEAVEQLQSNYLGPGDVVLDPAVDSQELLGGQIIFSPDVTQILFSTGWGPDQADDAFLLMIEDEAGQTRWGGMLYIFDALRNY